MHIFRKVASICIMNTKCLQTVVLMSVFSDPLAMSNKASTAQMFDNMSLDIEQLLAKVCHYFGPLFLSLILLLHCSNPVSCRFPTA